MTREFTDEEFIATDPLKEILGFGNEEDYLSMRDIAYSITHSHKGRTVLLTQRFIKSKVNMNGFSEEEPHQSSIIIPMDELQDLVLEIIASGMCMTIAEKEGRNGHEGE